MTMIERYARDEDGRLVCPRASAEDVLCAARAGDSAVSIVGLCVGCDHSPADLLKDLVQAITAANRESSPTRSYARDRPVTAIPPG